MAALGAFIIAGSWVLGLFIIIWSLWQICEWIWNWLIDGDSND